MPSRGARLYVAAANYNVVFEPGHRYPFLDDEFGKHVPLC
jgi:hypothetical protein